VPAALQFLRLVRSAAHHVGDENGAVIAG